jgi:hypothetical protein
MALKDLLHLAPPPAADRPAGVSCETYVRGEGKRCLHYGAGGACALPGADRCSEWLKANGRSARVDGSSPIAAVPAPAASAPPPRDLFGHALPAPPRGVAPSPSPAPGFPAPIAEPRRRAAPPRSALTAEDVASFKALGVEVRMHSDVVGELWLVPAYTGKPRVEITPEHAMTLMHVREVFPDAQVTSFEIPTHHERPERPQRRS